MILSNNGLITALKRCEKGCLESLHRGAFVETRYDGTVRDWLHNAAFSCPALGSINRLGNRDGHIADLAGRMG